MTGAPAFGGPIANLPSPDLPVLPADPLLLAQRIRALLRDSEMSTYGSSTDSASTDSSRTSRSTAARQRLIIGITGAPGAGKSTLATRVAAALGPAATLVGMDGFHLAQGVLDTLGMADIKGAPETFDAAGYVALLVRLLDPGEATIYAPEFRRAIEEPIAGAIAVPCTTRVIITEGNYLLLDSRPWDRLRSMVAEVWYLDTPEALRLDRLIDRHVAFGRTPDAAHERAVSGSDGRNATLVLASRGRADLILRP